MTDAEKVTRFKEALEEIVQAKGSFSMDPLVHARRVIRGMVTCARNVLSDVDELDEVSRVAAQTVLGKDA